MTRTLTLPCLAALLAAVSAPAQTAVAPSDSPLTLSPFVVRQRSDDGYGVHQTVSATRVATDLMDLPFDMSTLTGAFLQDINAADISQGLEYLNVNTQNNSFASTVSTTFLVRGFVADTLLNGFPAANNTIPVPASVVDRIEVLKGPASLLYGAVDPGGVVNIVSKRPLPHPFVDLSTTIGDYHVVNGNLDLGGPVTQDGRLSYRVTAAASRSDLIAKSSGTRRWEIAPMLQYRFNPDTELNAQFSVVKFHLLAAPLDGPAYTVLVPSTKNPQGSILGYYAKAWPRESNLRGPGDDMFGTQQYANLELRHRFNDHWNLRLAYAWVDQPFSRTTRAGGFLIAGTRNETDSRATGDAVTNSAQADLVGQYHFRWADWTTLAGASFDRFSNDGLTLNSPVVIHFNPADPNTWAQPVSPASTFTVLQGMSDGYGQNEALYSTQQLAFLGGRIHALAGGRWQESTATAINGVSHATNDFRLWHSTYQAGLVGKLRPWLSLYTSWSQSFVPQNQTLTTRKPYDPVTGLPLPGATNGSAPALPIEGKGNEVGLKLDLLHGHLTATAAWYDITRSNIVNNGLQMRNSQGVVVDTWQTQGGIERVEGQELDLDANLFNHSLSLLLNYTHTILGKLESYDANRAYIGKSIPFTPTSQLGFFARYSRPRGWLKGSFVGVGGQYTTAFELYPDTSPLIAEAPGFVLFNAVAGYRWRVGQIEYRAQVNMTNLQDRIAIRSIYSLTPPRSIQFTLGLHY
ncbi:MAG TPA: TonB-dependent receptor [Opitutaceae bacterium]|nr:TonB-dependent receptor [Opitutaceae bacterium]